MADDFRPGLLRHRDDPRLHAALRPRPAWHHPARLAAAERRDDRGRHADQQDGPGAAQGLRPDARAALGDQHGQLRQWRRLLPLFLFRGARLRPRGAGGRLCPGLPAHGRGAGLRHHAIAEEDPPRPGQFSVAEAAPRQAAPQPACSTPSPALPRRDRAPSREGRAGRAGGARASARR